MKYINETPSLETTIFYLPLEIMDLVLKKTKGKVTRKNLFMVSKAFRNIYFDIFLDNLVFTEMNLIPYIKEVKHLDLSRLHIKDKDSWIYGPNISDVTNLKSLTLYPSLRAIEGEFSSKNTLHLPISLKTINFANFFGSRSGQMYLKLNDIIEIDFGNFDGDIPNLSEIVPNLKVLKFGMDFNSEISLPTTLERLIFPMTSVFDNNLSLPHTIKEITFGQDFAQQITGLEDTKIEKLRIGNIFWLEGLIDTGKLKYLKTLYLMLPYDVLITENFSLDNTMLTDLTIYTTGVNDDAFTDIAFKTPIESLKNIERLNIIITDNTGIDPFSAFVCFCRKLKKLEVSMLNFEMANEDFFPSLYSNNGNIIEELPVSENIEELNLLNCIPLTCPLNNLPVGLKVLHLPRNWNQDPDVFRNIRLEKIYFGHFFNKNIDTLPSSLRVIHLGKMFTVKINFLPYDLQELKIPSDYPFINDMPINPYPRYECPSYPSRDILSRTFGNDILECNLITFVVEKLNYTQDRWKRIFRIINE